MINFDDVERENINEHNLNLPQTPDHVFRILITGGTGSGKTNALLTVYTNKTMKDPNVQVKCRMFIKILKSTTQPENVIY